MNISAEQFQGLACARFLIITELQRLMSALQNLFGIGESVLLLFQRSQFARLQA